MSKYEEILRPVIAQIGHANCSMIDYAQAIKTCIETEMDKLDSDQALIGLLINAACVGWELIEEQK